MAYKDLKNAIKQVIKNNNNQEITGDLLQNALLSIISAGIESGYLLKEFVDPDSTPAVADDKHIYIPTRPGLYTHFNNTEVKNSKFSCFYYSGDTWKLAISKNQYLPPAVSNAFRNFSIDTDKKLFSIADDTNLWLISNESGLIFSQTLASQMPVDLSSVKDYGADGTFIYIYLNYDLQIKAINFFDEAKRHEMFNTCYVLLFAFYSVRGEHSDDYIDNRYVVIHSAAPIFKFNGKTYSNYCRSMPVGTSHTDSGFTNMYIIGDSWTAGQGGGGTHYYDNLKNDCGLSKLTVDGIEGTTWTTGESNDFVSRMRSITSDYDLILIFGGTNDYGHNRPIGDFESFDTDYFYGALRKGCEYLLSNFPYATIFFVTPGQRKKENVNTQGNTLSDYVDAMLRVAKYYSIPVLDIYSGYITGKVENVITNIMPDGLHPNAAGYKRLGRKIAKFINYKL